MCKGKMLCLVLLAGILGSLNAKSKFSGYIFGDFYYVMTHHDSTYNGQNGFWFRRIYLTYDKRLNEKISIRLRMEMKSSDFTEDPQRIYPFIKDAYLKWKIRKTSFILGISPTPTWDLIEKFWGYRSVEKTAPDLQKFGSSRDFGIAFKGKFIRKMGYHLMLANGEGNKSENNKFKKFMSAIDFRISHFIIQIYGDWEEEKGDDIYTFQGFLGFKLKQVRTGIHYSRQIKGEEKRELASAFVIYDLKKSLSLILRYDKMFDPSPSGISYTPFAQAKSNLLIAGFDLRPNKYIHFIPNVEYVFYEREYKPDIYLRLTFHYKFNL